MSSKNIKGLLFFLLIGTCTWGLCGCTGKNNDEVSNKEITEISTDGMECSTKAESFGWEWFIEPAKYEDIVVCDENLIAVKEDLEGYSLIDQSRNIISKEKYAKVFDISEKIVKVFKGNFAKVLFEQNERRETGVIKIICH